MVQNVFGAAQRRARADVEQFYSESAVVIRFCLQFDKHVFLFGSQKLGTFNITCSIAIL